MTRRCFGLDVHREFAQVAIWQDGSVRQAGQIPATPEGLRRFADSLGPSDEVALEATCNTHAIAKLLQGRVARGVISNPQKTRAIAEAKVKTDKVDAAVLAELLACDYLPSVWLADDATHALRRQVARRAHIVRQRTRLKNQVQAILHRNLIARCPAADLFGHKGRRWLAAQDLPADERQAVAALLRQLDFHGHELRVIDAELGRVALASVEVKRLMTIPGVDATVALSIVAAVGDDRPVRRAREAGQLPRAESARQAVWRPARRARADHQAGARARARDAGRGRLGGVQDPRPAQGVLSARARPPRDAGRRRGDRAQARRALLAPGHQGPGLRVRQAVADRPEAAPPRAQGRAAVQARPEGQGRRLLAQGGPRPRERAQRAGRTRVCPDGRRLASQGARDQDRGRGRRQRGATLKALRRGHSCAAGLSPRTCASLGGRPRPQRSLTPADTHAERAATDGAAAACPKSTPIPAVGPETGPQESICAPARTSRDRSDPGKPPPHQPRALDTFIRGVDRAAQLL